jgi:hypothetical protein
MRDRTTGEGFIPRSDIGAQQSSRRIKCERVAQRKENVSGLLSAPFLKDGTQKCASDASAALEVVPTPTASLCDSTGE